MRKKTQEEFISEARAIHGNKYDYSHVHYVNVTTPVEIICDIHGPFMQTPHKHLCGSGCYKCGKKRAADAITKNTERFVNEARKVHGDKYDYSKVEYVGRCIPVIIICKRHGEFKQTPHEHLDGHGCQKCNASHGEKAIIEWLDSHGINYEFDKTIKGCKYKGHLRFDFIIPQNNLIIEFQGSMHYSKKDRGGRPLSYYQARDQTKRDFCIANNIRLEEIRYDEDLEARLREIFNV